ncbi:MAG: polysaccharide deacetylase family protein [Chloroflexi bacterium]|nr:polysaccharide deacetylase family protein [Chloroflexota bacterium]
MARGVRRFGPVLLAPLLLAASCATGSTVAPLPEPAPPEIAVSNWAPSPNADDAAEYVPDYVSDAEAEASVEAVAESVASPADSTRSLADREASARLSAGQILGGQPAPTPAPPPAPKPDAMTMVPILMYHYIRDVPANSPDKLGYGLSVAPAVFDQQLSYLKANGYASVSMADVVSHVTLGAPLPPKPVVLTFDDGYADFYMAALPLLQKYQFTATTYLVVDFLGRPGYMSWQQAQTLQGLGMEIGAHTLDHVDLAIQQPPQAIRQIDDSRTALQQRLSAPVQTFAYPSGRYNTNVVKLVGADGFTSAVTTDPGDRYPASKLLTLPRVRVAGGENLAAFAKSLAA